VAYCYTDGVAWSVGLSVMTVSPAEVAKPIVMPFGVWTRVGPRNYVLDWVQIPIQEGAILRAKKGRPRACPDMSGGRFTKCDSAGSSTGTVRMPIGVY